MRTGNPFSHVLKILCFSLPTNFPEKFIRYLNYCNNIKRLPC